MYYKVSPHSELNRCFQEVTEEIEETVYQKLFSVVETLDVLLVWLGYIFWAQIWEHLYRSQHVNILIGFLLCSSGDDGWSEIDGEGNIF